MELVRLQVPQDCRTPVGCQTPPEKQGRNLSNADGQVTGCSGFLGTFKGLLIQTSMGRDIFNWTRLLRALSSLSWGQGIFFWSFTTFIVKKSFFIPTLNQPSSSLKPLFPSQEALLKVLLLNCFLHQEPCQAEELINVNGGKRGGKKKATTKQTRQQITLVQVNGIHSRLV